MANKITVTSLGTTANVNATPDSARYYSDKSKEWAISDKLIDNEDYSSKYYANESKKQADISTAKATEVVESGNNAVSNIESARDNAITDITNQESLSVDNVNTAGATQIALATEQANIAKEQATIATNKTSEVVASGNTALNNIDTAKSSAMTDITNLKNTSVSNITTAKNNAITTITTQETTSKNNVVATGNAQVERVNLTGVDNRTPMFTKGEKETNEGVYQNVYDLKHSTFDKSKFTVIGNPTITDDGILSNTTNKGSLKVASPIPNILNAKEYVKVRVKVHTPKSNLNPSNVWLDLINLGDRTTGFVTGGNYTYRQIYIRIDGIDYISTNAWNYDTDYYFEFLINLQNKTVTITVYDMDNVIVSTKTQNYTSYTLKDNLKSIMSFDTPMGNSFMDVKSLSITVDGKEVFNGNKTGIDVIKADNYEVVGSPVITDDGVVSGISASNYLTFPLNINPQNTLKIQIEGVHGDTQTSAGTLFYISDGTTSLTLYRNRSSKMSGEVGSTSKTYLGDSAVTTNGARYKYVVSFDIVTNEYSYQYCENDVLITQKDNMLISVLANMNWSNITIGNIGQQYSPLNGSLDLNAFKIYVDGNLVYQPCLKIPYTQSKTGSKIVDVAYRDRVIDLYEQEGQAGYYTIDEDNKNFTLPMGEIYGMIGQRSLISSTVTETNRVDIYSDKTCLICGNVATAGTINLPIELVNKNYFITLPTSAKTATSFTTTATGDYILIGKVI